VSKVEATLDTATKGPKWDEGGLGEYRFVDSTDRILGRVIWNSLGMEYIAQYEGSGIGTYISREAAEKAVERKHNKDLGK
jgi:hypothetical protein